MIDIDTVIVDNTNVSKPLLRGLLHELQDAVGDGSALGVNYVLPPTLPPTPAVNATAGNINGACYYSITFVSALGESEASFWSTVVAPANQRVNLTGIQVSPNPAVTARRIYRTPAGAADPVLGKLVATINDNTTTTYTDNLADGGLGAPAIRIATDGGVLRANGVVFASANSLSTRFGKNSQPNDIGYANSSFGSNSLSLNTTGFRITAIGVDAGQNNTTGYEFTAVGVHALGANTTGKQSCAFGYNALGNSNGDFNAAFGTLSMSAITTGDNNTAYGTFSLQQCTTGSSNVAVGIESFWSMLTGIGNVAVGARAGFTGTGGNFNTYIGHNAGYAGAAGSSNVGVGAFALNSLVVGGGNVAIGQNAGYYETGDNHLWIDNQQRANLADARTKALIYGTFNPAVASQELIINAAKVVLNGIPTFADNTAAAALAVGSIYRTATGVLMIRF